MSTLSGSAIASLTQKLTTKQIHWRILDQSRSDQAKSHWHQYPKWFKKFLTETFGENLDIPEDPSLYELLDCGTRFFQSDYVRNPTRIHISRAAPTRKTGK